LIHFYKRYSFSDMKVAEGEWPLKPCSVRMSGSLAGLRKCFILMPAIDITHYEVPTWKTDSLTREEKILLLPKRKSPKKRQKAIGRPKGSKSRPKSPKFKLVLGRVSPDSGISSRSNTPDQHVEDEEESGSEADSDVFSDLMQTDMEQEKINADFLASLEDDDENDKMAVVSKTPVTVPKTSAIKPVKPFHPLSIVPPPASKSAYELERDKRIQEKNSLLAALSKEWKTFKQTTAPAKPIPVAKKAPRPRQERVVKEPSEIRRSGRVKGERVNYTGLDDEEAREYGRTLRAADGTDDHVYRQRKKPRRGDGASSRCKFDPNVDILRPEDITPEMIARIAVYVSDKVYDSALGSSCHQCRQKTIDMKTVCRSGFCVGVKGQFCAVCLRNRYGEDMKEVLMDPEWKCPYCRGICNCSFCLDMPTGQLINVARSHGFESVHHYLVHLREKHGVVED